MLSTSRMIEYVKEKPEGSFVVATENGMLYPIHQIAPEANLIEADPMPTAST